MPNPKALLPGALVLVFLPFIIANPDVSAIEKPGSDPTRPSDSIKTEEQKEVQIEEESDGKNVPSSPKIDESTYGMQIDFSYISFHKKGNYHMFLYVNGKEVKLQHLYGGSPASNIFLLDRDQQPYYLDDTLEFRQKNHFIFTFPVDKPLSIMMGGYKHNSNCPWIEYQQDISDQVFAANGNKDLLLVLQKTLTAKASQPCGLASNFNNNLAPRHHILGYINEVYDPLHLSSDYPTYLRKCIDSTGTDEFDFRLCYTIYTKHVEEDIQK